MRSPVEERWVRRFRDDDGCATKLVCFPHAGGWANAYRTWHLGLPSDIGVLAVRYPGREDRLSDPFPSGLEALADDIADALGELTRHRLVLFGHSMGASVAHEVALRLQKRGCPPAALCVSGRRPPHALDGQRRLSGTDEEIVADVVRFDESRAPVFADPDLREILLPAVRADYRLVDDYRGGRRPLLDCPVYGYAGDDDSEVTPKQMRDWADTTHDAFRLRVLPGGHFYLRAQEAALLADMRNVLGRIKSRTSASS
ncbi:pyochelin biosynthetic protein PchC [Streptomyces griseochromogenes]|uniref:Pyochelin biosynthetic protein PchC n=1 Tax=Streptomyces griseochromogenes TaxID=68214 RepID=A0A1B1AU38_9ACTN|nr:alpha/beta fold hydrolase [Streptomyces griseochromogenes]ANP50067.1 thioesterase [Streptomyces griseochromogenes]MBP2048316.1 pyochelin biosynthetic protein PchC [Streptomyces griseochromogenes]